MRGLLGGLLISLVGGAPLIAQERDRSLERIRVGLEAPLPLVRGTDPAESTLPKSLGIFTLVEPQLRGEMVRVSVPIGALVMRAVRSVTTGDYRRQEAAARRRVAAELKAFEEQQQSSPKR